MSRTRVSQIMRLTLLAPDIQEAILFWPGMDGGRASIRERMLCTIAVVPDRRIKWRMWVEMVGPRNNWAGDPVRGPVD
jgi:hypothetical protein